MKSGDYDAYVRHVIEETLPSLQDTDAFVSFPPHGFSDPATGRQVQFCTELGMALMLGKTIIFVVAPGVPLPEKLMPLAHAVLEGDISTPQGQDSLSRRLDQTLKRLKG